MSNTVSCTSCGKELGQGDRFCPGCGATVGEPAAGGEVSDLGTNPTQCVTCAAPMGRDDRFCPKCGTSRPAEATVISHVSLRNAQAAHLIEATEGEFEIIRQLGTGAMGAVYLAVDIALGREVAIKVIAPNLLSDESMVSRFRMEAQTVAALRHPNIVSVHAVRQSDDLHYFVMEFIDGPALRSIVKGHAPLEIDVVQSLLFQVGSALSYAHRTKGGVIHRDVKPANIMVDKEGGAFVTDFGISKIAEVNTGLTQTGATIGTPEYMSPEQCRGEALTGASDQYALGIVAYEMLTGQTPFSGNQYRIMVAHTSEAPRPIREVRADCPPLVAGSVERMLAKNPEERWPDLDAAVTAMGGAPLSYNSPTRTKIITLTGATLVDVPAVETGPSQASGAEADTATSVTVTGIPSVVEAGDTFTLEADVRGTGEHSPAGLGVVWASTDPSIAKVDGGVVEAFKVGAVSITATAGNVANSVLLTVAEPSPAAVLVRPGSVRIHQGGRIGLSAVVQDRKGRDLDRAVAWRTGDPAIATVSEGGQVVATGTGSVSVIAESEGVTGTAEVIVEVPAEAPAALGLAEAVPGVESAPRPRYATSKPVYQRPGAIAAAIVLIALAGIGVANMGGGRPSAAAPPAEPDAGAVDAGVTDLVPTAENPSPATDPPGAAADQPPDVEPEPTEPARTEPEPTATVASDPPAGRGNPPAGRGNPPAGRGNPPAGRGNAPPPPPPPAPAPTPASVEVTLASAAMAVGGTQDLSASVLSASGGQLTSGYTLSWRSTDPSIVEVDAQGTAEASGAGSAWVVASAGNVSDSALVTVEAVPGAVEIAGGDVNLPPGGSRTLSASVLDSDGNVISGSVRWSSSDAAVVAVDAGSGRLTAGSTGTARITASAEGFSDEISATVELALPTQAYIQGALQDYVGFLSGENEEALRRLWGSGDPDALDSLLDLMGERDFAASLESVGYPTEQGGAVVVPFQVRGSYRNFAGGNRESELSFVGRFEPSGSGWRLLSAVLQ